MKAPADSSTEIEYPSSDGERMSENQWQFWAMFDAIIVLQAHFANRPAHAMGDLYKPIAVPREAVDSHEEGNPAVVVAPDVFVVIGAQKDAT